MKAIASSDRKQTGKQFQLVLGDNPNHVTGFQGSNVDCGMIEMDNLHECRVRGGEISLQIFNSEIDLSFTLIEFFGFWFLYRLEQAPQIPDEKALQTFSNQPLNMVKGKLFDQNASVFLV